MTAEAHLRDTLFRSRHAEVRGEADVEGGKELVNLVLALDMGRSVMDHLVRR
ncbi:MAG: hypothetical protein OXC14_10300 [Rhodospirillaceae bacterium]|nr:hypothetical protein [Rhodospirillaceae bacterium]